jgi:COMPASS component SWD3
MSPTNPDRTDAILGGQNPSPTNSAILGGLAGVKQRLLTSTEEVQIAALHEALKYDDPGLDLAIDTWKNESSKLKWEAFSLLRNREEEKVQQALKKYNPWLNLTCLHTWQQDSAVKCVALDRKGTTLVSGTQSGAINVWDMETKQEKVPMMKHRNTGALAISPDGRTLVSSGVGYDNDSDMRIWNLETGDREATRYEHSTYVVLSLLISPEGKFIVCGNTDTTIHIWDLKTKGVVKTIPSARYLVQALAISNDGKILVGGGDNKKVKVWNFDTGKLLVTFKGHGDGIESVAIAPNGQTVVSGGKDRTVRVWDIKTKEIQLMLEGHTDSIYHVAVSPDGNYIFSCGRDKTIRVWDLHTGECQHILKDHTGWVYCLAVSPDGKTLVSCSRDKTIRLWGHPINT